jgi:hypothetical protein
MAGMSPRRERGQALVEFTLVQPIFVLWLVVVFATGFAFLTAMRAQNGIAVLAQRAASQTGWESEIGEENDRSGCNAKPAHPTVEYPDGNKDPGSIIHLTWQCHVLIPAIAGISPSISYAVSADAVIAGKESPSASPSPSPSASPSSSP